MEEKIKSRKAVIIGGSAGSLKVILNILKNLKADLEFPIIIIIHRKHDPDSSLIDVLAQNTMLNAKEAEDKEFILPGTVYLAPSGYHLLIEKDYSFSLDGSEAVNFSKPSIDVSFQTAAEAYGVGLLAIVLSGANGDGTVGCKEVNKFKGTTIVQDPSEAESPFMPEQVLKAGLASKVATTDRLTIFVRDFQNAAIY